jgi:hypothetical protein
MAENFKFDPINHEYFSGERKLPSVTDIVGDVYGNPNYATEWHMNRGSQIHRCISLFLNKKLNEDTVDGRIRGYFESAKRAIKELKIMPPWIIEKPFYHPTLFFAGTPDLYSSGLLIDWKTGTHRRESEIQIGGYIALLEEQTEHPKKAYEIVLEEKRYRIFEYKPQRSKGLFLATLSIFKWKQK